MTQETPCDLELITADINREKDYFTMDPRAHLNVAMVDLNIRS